MIQERYIVDVHRIDGVWEYEMEHDGVTTKIPRAVFDKFMDDWAAVANEGRRRRGKAQAESKRNGAKAEDPETDPDFAMVLGRMGSPPDGPFGAPGGSQYDGGGTNLALRVVGLQNNFGERVQDAGRPGQPPEDAFHRLQRACKAYGYSLRPEAGQTKKAEALLELLNCALEAPLGSGVFRQGFSAEEWCLEATKRFPELNKDGKPRVL